MKSARNGGFQGENSFYCFSVVFRQVPWGSAVARCAHMPIILRIAPILDHPTNTRRFETTETSGIGEWGGKAKTRGPKVPEVRKRVDLRGNALLLVFRGHPPGPASFHGGLMFLRSCSPWFLGESSSSADVDCAHCPFSSLLYAAPHQYRRFETTEK